MLIAATSSVTRKVIFHQMAAASEQGLFLSLMLVACKFLIVSLAGSMYRCCRRTVRKPCPGKLHCRNKVVIESQTMGAFVVCYKVLGEEDD
jgi:hypothetical protein